MRKNVSLESLSLLVLLLITVGFHLSFTSAGFKLQTVHLFLLFCPHCHLFKLMI
ncbi:CYFA0S19e00188g1_1 [Cyberlindnera fabianii]|uniref:CYFA0S19e00188g1_1 n=1 Tax=Cyberlindnera fabianii TaxID=36022 RepID=A0A061B864_CYBFA|nr:CYFA0S19e00188g1_1 [Cyberlindnera fabianii]